MGNFKIGERVQVNTDSGWRFGMVDNRTADRRGMLYVVSLESGGVVYARDADLASCASRVKSLSAEFKVKALRAKYKSKVSCPCGDPNCPNPGDCDAMGHDDEDS